MSAAAGPAAHLRDHRGLGARKRLADAGLFVAEAAIAVGIARALRQDPGQPEAPAAQPVAA